MAWLYLLMFRTKHSWPRDAIYERYKLTNGGSDIRTGINEVTKVGIIRKRSSSEIPKCSQKGHRPFGWQIFRFGTC